MRYRVLNKNRDFTRIYARGKSYVVGGAVQRNRARRVMRAALAEHLSPNCGGYDIILVARARTPHLKSTQVSRTLAALLQRAGLPDRAREG